MSTLAERAEAAIELVRLRELAPASALALTVWPPAALEAVKAKPQEVSEEELARIAAMAAAGLSHKKIGEQLGRPRSTVSAVLRSRDCQLTLGV